MSGHNKWSKIKHKKAATDAERSRLFSKHANIIAIESRKAGGDISSPNLAAAVERAKKDSMPKDNIERAVARGREVGGAHIEEVLFEAFGPGGVALLIVAVTDNNNRTAPEVRNIFSKAGLSLGTPGSAIWAFAKHERRYAPLTPITLNEKDEVLVSQLVEKLYDHPDVQEVFTTADTPE